VGSRFLLYVVGGVEGVSGVSVGRCSFLASCFENSSFFSVVLCGGLEDCVMCVAELLLAGVGVSSARILDVDTLRVLRIRLDVAKPEVVAGVDDYLSAKRFRVVCRGVGDCLAVVRMFMPRCIKYVKISRGKEIAATIELSSNCEKELREIIKQLRRIQVENILNGLCKPSISIHIENDQANAIPLKILLQPRSSHRTSPHQNTDNQNKCGA